MCENPTDEDLKNKKWFEKKMKKFNLYESNL